MTRLFWGFERVATRLLPFQPIAPRFQLLSVLTDKRLTTVAEHRLTVLNTSEPVFLSLVASSNACTIVIILRVFISEKHYRQGISNKNTLFDFVMFI